MGVAPIGAIRKVLDRAGMTIGDVDVVELNEAFAAQVAELERRQPGSPTQYSTAPAIRPSWRS